MNENDTLCNFQVKYTWLHLLEVQNEYKIRHACYVTFCFDFDTGQNLFSNSHLSLYCTWLISASLALLQIFQLLCRTDTISRLIDQLINRKCFEFDLLASLFSQPKIQKRFQPLKHWNVLQCVLYYVKLNIWWFWTCEDIPLGSQNVQRAFFTFMTFHGLNDKLKKPSTDSWIGKVISFSLIIETDYL